MSFAPVEHPSDLTPLQRQYLPNLQEFCHRPPTLGRIYRKTWLSVVGLLVVGVGGCAILLMRDLEQMALILGGAITGVFLRDFGFFRQTVKLWPASLAVLDQRKINELLDEPHHDASW